MLNRKKTGAVLVAFICIILGAVGFAFADNLIDNGGGFIWDSDLNITWYVEPNNIGMGWDNARNWAAGLTYGGVSGWRLPNADPTCTTAPNCINSEMGHLYYVELENTSIGGMDNKGPFTNIQTSTTLPVAYWSSTEYQPVDPSAPAAWAFNFTDGYQGPSTKVHQYYALAVHQGNIAPIPEPNSLLLLCSGLGMLWGFRKKI